MTHKETALDHIGRLLIPIEEKLAPIPRMKEMFHTCYVNTLETTLIELENGEAFCITGDIPAMWLRDSSQQVHHYIRFASQDKEIADLVKKIIAKQAELVLIDPYANSFNESANGKHFTDDIPTPDPSVWERKYETDSLCHVVWLSKSYYDQTGDASFLTPQYMRALHTIVDVFACEQEHELKSEYRFMRRGEYAFESLPREGKGNPTAYTGMTWSGFRPSDDPCQYGYLVPANLFAESCMRHVETFARMMNDEPLREKASRLAMEIGEGVRQYGVIDKAGVGKIYAYETDGYGNHLIMDDANIPGLLSLPYLGICDKTDELYIRTRQVCLSEANPYYFTGEKAKGIGSPHTPNGYVWHIALCVQGLTSGDLQEKADLLDMLLHTTGDQWVMHESFHPDKPEEYTRSWFAWANSMFAEFVYQLYEQGELEAVMEKLIQGSAV